MNKQQLEYGVKRLERYSQRHEWARHGEQRCAPAGMLGDAVAVDREHMVFVLGQQLTSDMEQAALRLQARVGESLQRV